MGAVAFMERAAVAEPPAELLTRILHHAPAGVQTTSERRSWLRRVFGNFFESVLQPRYAMGMAMTILSFSMIAKFAGIEPRQLRPSDLDPVKIWASIDDHAQRTYDRAMKYYENLRLVIEIQSRLTEWSEQEQAAAARTDNGNPKANSSGQKPEDRTKATTQK